MRPRLLAIGDIHGSIIALRALIEELQLNHQDKLIFLGDYIDRGENSRAVIEEVIHLKERIDVVCLLGNHEEMMKSATISREYFDNWINYGGDQTLKSYDLPIIQDSLNRIPKQHWDFISQCQDYFETDSFIFSHAPINPEKKIENQTEEELRWNKTLLKTSYIGGKTVIYGHASQKSGSILASNQSICIDTYAYGGGWLTCLDVQERHFLQANNFGDLRRGSL